ncbi:MAG: hypothetical protein JW750_12635 [Anaerolineaceae bacterium]|nr:hypothetical protein [Anaerolineaceae bacterium]
MSEKREYAIFLMICALVLLLTTLPILFGYLAAGADHHFSGFLFNPIDNHSYLAKMRQGYEGSWRFTLPYSAEAGEGVFLFVFYLFWGHAARWFGLSLPLTYALARLLAVGFLLYALRRFNHAIFPDSARQRLFAFALAALGSGLGWLFFLFLPAMPSDFWVAEAYPFLSSYANPHFPFGLALVLLLLTPDPFHWKDWRTGALHFMLSVLLGFSAPFNIVVVIVVRGVMLLWQFAARNDWHSALAHLIWIGVGGGSVLLYQYVTILQHPVLSLWNEQNITASPPFYDYLIAFSPALLLAAPGAVWYWKRAGNRQKILVFWFITCLLLVYVPFNLQRRFIVGFYVPAACLAVAGFSALTVRQTEARRKLSALLLVGLSVLTNLVVLASGLIAAQSRAPQVYLTADEFTAVEWLADHAAEGDLVLSSEEIGNIIPAYSRARVVVGHPFETVNAESETAFVTDFYSGRLPLSNLIERGVTLVFYGPREQALGPAPLIENLVPVFQSDTVQIFSIP